MTALRETRQFRPVPWMSGLGRVVLKERNKQSTAFYPAYELRTNLPETV